MDPSKYVSGAEKVSWATKQMLREQEAADRKWRAMQGAHQSALDEEARRQAKVAQVAAQAEERKRDAISKTSTALVVGGAAAVVGAGLMIKTYADFDKQMSAVKATGGATASELNKLRDAAIDMGAKTTFSASESAAGIENLLKAGVAAKDVLGGGLAGSLDLAAAGELSVASAAEIAATAMTQFKLGGDDVTHIADLLAAGAGKAQGSVDDMAQALKQGGLVAAQTGLTIEETTGTLSAFASAGLLGSDAGTSMKTMLQRLSAPTKENAKLMEELGISAYDAQGQFVGMEQFAGQLTDALGDMTPAQRNAALATIFGSDAVRAASVIYDQGESGIRNWISAVDDQGYAAETAAARLDNLNGDVEALTGALESAFIKSGSGGNDMLRGLTQGITGVVNALGSIDGSVLSGLTIALGAGGVVALGVGGLGKLIVGLNNAKGAMSDLGIMSEATATKAATVGTTIGKWAIGIGTAVVALETLNAATDRAQIGTEEVDSKLKGLGGSKDVVKDLFGDLVPKDSDLARGKDFATFLDQMANPGAWASIGAHASDLGVSITRIFGDDSAKWGELKQRMSQYGDQLGTLATSDMPAAVDAFAAMGDAAGNYRGVNEDLLKVMPGFRDALIGVAEGAGLATDDATLLRIATGEIAPVMDSATSAAETNAGAHTSTAGAIDEEVASLEALIEAQQKAAGVVLDEREARRAYQEQLDAAKKSLEENGATLDRNTEAGRANEESLDGIAKKALDVAASMEQNGASQEKVQRFVKSSRADFLAQADALGVGEKKANALADKLGLIPGNYEADASVNTAAAEVALHDFLTKLEGADGTIKIKGDGAPAERKLNDVTAQVNEADGSVTILGKDGKAVATLRDYTATVNESDGSVTIKGKDKQGRDTVLKLTSWVGDQTPKLKVGANTSDAQADVNKFIKDNTKLALKIGTQFFAPKNSTGDGEGAGWPGKTPHGVSQMTSAVKSLDSGAQITSGYRPGAVTSTGYPSYHGMGRAIDIVSPNMGRTWDLLRRAFGSRAKELYYTPRGFIRNGQMTNDVASVTRAQHYSHVHLALAKGGAARGPGTGTSDEIPAWLSNGEHVLTASDVRKLGGQDAVYKLRDAIQAGKLNLDPEPAFAKGGAVGSASRAATQARKELAAEKADLSSLKQYLREARKKKREKQVAELEKKIDRQERAVDKAEERYAKARERVSNLQTERTQLGLDLRRGNILDSATSGASGAYGVVDDMLGLARSGDLTKRQSNRLATKAREAESAMRGLYKEVDKVDKRLESAAAKTEKLQAISDAVKNTLMGEQSLASSITAAKEGEYRDVTRTNSRGETWTEQMWDPGTKASVTAKGMVSNTTSKVAKARAFVSKLGALRKAGMSGVLIDEIANEGIENGTLIADAWLADKGQIQNINTAYKDLAKYSGQAGQVVTEGYSKGGLSAAKSFEAGLEKQKSSLEKRVYNWGVVMANAVSIALTGKATSLKKRASGGDVRAGESYMVGERGPELITPSRNGYVLTAEQTRRLATTSQTMTHQQIVNAGPLVSVTVQSMVTADVNTGVRALRNEFTDAVHTYGLDRIAQGVG
jgi:TP901 family phage tail tape measure protein